MNTLPRNSVCLGAPAKLQRPGNARTGSIWVLLKSAQLSWTYLQLEVTAAQVLDKYWQIRQCHKNTTRHTSSFNSHSAFVLRLAASALSVAIDETCQLGSPSPLQKTRLHGTSGVNFWRIVMKSLEGNRFEGSHRAPQPRDVKISGSALRSACKIVCRHDVKSMH